MIRDTRIRLDPELVERAEAAANERVVSLRWLVGRILEEGLDRLTPVADFRLTRAPEKPRDSEPSCTCGLPFPHPDDSDESSEITIDPAGMDRLS